MVAFHHLRAIGLSNDFPVQDGLDYGRYPIFSPALLYVISPPLRMSG